MTERAAFYYYFVVIYVTSYDDSVFHYFNELAMQIKMCTDTECYQRRDSLCCTLLGAHSALIPCKASVSVLEVARKQ